MSWLRPSCVGRVGCLSINARYFPRDREGLNIYRVWFMKGMQFDMSTAHFAFTTISIIPRRVVYIKKRKWGCYEAAIILAIVSLAPSTSRIHIAWGDLCDCSTSYTSHRWALQQQQGSQVRQYAARNNVIALFVTSCETSRRFSSAPVWFSCVNINSAFTEVATVKPPIP